MNESTIPTAPESTERYKTLIVVLTLITTIITAVVATLQASANIRANTANRDLQYYAIMVTGELHRSGLQSSYDFSTLVAVMLETQTSLMMQFTALQSEQNGNSQGVEINNYNAVSAQARADMLKKFSIFHTDPRYSLENMNFETASTAYLANSTLKVNEYMEQQNTAADNYHLWSSKADAYVGVLTVLAVAFFLFGLAQALTGRMRLVFAIFGTVILLAASSWTVLILVI